MMPSLPSPEKIRNPISLLAYIMATIVALAAVGIYYTKSVLVGPLGIVVAGLLAGLVIWRYESIAQVEIIRKNVQLLQSELNGIRPKASLADAWTEISGIRELPKAPVSLPLDLSMTAAHLDFWQRHVRPALEQLNFVITEHASATQVGQTYYFTEAVHHSQDKKIVFVGLPPEFLLYGSSWQENAWLASLKTISKPNFLVVTCDISMTCDKALHEKEEVEMDGTPVIFIFKSMKGWLMQTDCKKYLEQRLGL
jgi:hypothetical protein